MLQNKVKGLEGVQLYAWNTVSESCLPPSETWCVLCSDTWYMRLFYMRSKDYRDNKTAKMKENFGSFAVGGSIWDGNGLPKIAHYEGSEWKYWMAIEKPCGT